MKLRSWLALAASLVVSACGGGGGGGSGSGSGVAVAFTPSNLSAAAFQQQQAGVTAFQDATVSVDAAVTGSGLSGVVYAVVQDTAAGFAGSPVQVVQTGTGYRATLKPNVALAPGTYTGTLVLHLCKDAGCAQEYAVSGGTLPYQVTIAPRLQMAVLVNGSAAGTARSGTGTLPLSIADGTTVEIQSNVAMQVMYSSGPGFVGVTVDPASTATTWRAVLARPAFPSTNQITLAVTPRDGTAGVQMSANLDVTMVP